MPIAADPVLRPLPSTSRDGLDLTVAEARAMSSELFRRTFGFAGLDDVTTVGPGFRDRSPRDCGWYVRFRPRPQNPKPKDRKIDSWELVVKSPQPQSEGGTGAGRKVYGLDAKEADAARLEALVFLARKSGRRIRATTWPVERIESLLVRDVLEAYADGYLLDPSEEEKRQKVDQTRTSYLSGVRAFQAAFPALEVGDIGDWIPRKYDLRASHRSPQTRHTDLHAAKRGVRLGLKQLGVANYDAGWKVPGIGMLPKVSWMPDQYDRLRAAADGYVFGTDGTPRMVETKDGPVPLRRSRRAIDHRGAWRRAIPFLTWTVTRHGRLATTRWLPPEVDPADGLPLPAHDRPWIEVLDHGIFYHRDGESRYEGNKRRGGNKIPKEFEAEVRAWYEADMALGREFVFHKRDGARFLHAYIGRPAFNNIVADAGLDMRRVPHHFKDLAVQMSDEAGIPREVLAAHADTTTEMLARKYGEPTREALKEHAAEKMTDAAWRGRAARKAEVTKLFEQGRARAAEATEKAQAAKTRRTRTSDAGLRVVEG
jgi:hypothetical protein